MSEEHRIEIFVDDEPKHVAEARLRAVQIIALAKMDPAHHYLVRVRGEGQDAESYKDDPDKEIELEAGMRFFTVHCGPTPLS